MHGQIYIVQARPFIPAGRDRGLVAWPAFETNARFDHGFGLPPCAVAGRAIAAIIINPISPTINKSLSARQWVLPSV